jgi:hypothetical protein
MESVDRGGAGACGGERYKIDALLEIKDQIVDHVLEGRGCLLLVVEALQNE